tara:strand:+ start:6979 stop:8091 length:1113 start_codon:yes stop_codon:yes gene_type:complete
MKLGVIGFGQRLSHMVNLCMREIEPDLSVVAAIDPDEEKVRSLLPEKERGTVSFVSSVAELVAAGVDAIAVGTRCNLHAGYAMQVAETGLPLFLEKPIATTMEDALALEKAFKHTKTQTVVSFPLRVTPLCERVKQLLDSGMIGTPRHVTAMNYVPYGDVYFNSWYRDYSVTGGLFLQKATHDFDYLAYCVGHPIVRVVAMKSCGKVFRDKSFSSGEENADCGFYENIGTPETGMNEDSSTALLEFANGTQGVYTQVFYSKQGAATRGATFSGYQGTLEFDWCKDRAKLVHHFKPFEDEYKVAGNLHHHGGDGQLAKNFLEVVRGERESISTIWDGLRSVYACLAAKESSETGQFCNVRQLSERASTASD